MDESKRLLPNVAASYVRSLFCTLLSLVSSRWLIQALGHSDFGLFSLVGSLIVMVTFLNNITANSSARFFAFSIGEGGGLEVQRWFGAAVSAHTIIAICIVLIGVPFGEYAIGHVLSIPSARLETVQWIFYILLCASFISMVSVPFAGMLTAHQRIADLSLIAVIQSVGICAVAGVSGHFRGDKLLFYSFGFAVVGIATNLLIILKAIAAFSECRIRLVDLRDHSRIRRIGGFSAWYLFGGLGLVSRDQGLAMLLNVKFGSTLNAAYGIAIQISTAANQLSAAMAAAFTPEITRSEGQGDRKRMMALADRVNRLGTVAVALVAIPLMIEMDYVLAAWLKVVPSPTTVMCQLALMVFLIDRLTSGYMLAISAFGDVARYQVTMCICLVITLPIAWAGLQSGLAPWFVNVASVGTMCLCCFGRVAWAKRLLEVDVREWLWHCLMPAFALCFLSAAFAGLIRQTIAPSVYRLALVSTVSIVVGLSSGWVWLTRPEERAILRRWVAHCCRM